VGESVWGCALRGPLLRSSDKLADVDHARLFVTSRVEELSTHKVSARWCNLDVTARCR
jgi:hypothetical protein